MVNYNDGKIYKIIDNTNDNIYIGSTTQRLSKRLYEHKRDAKCYFRNGKNYITSFDIIKNNNYQIILIENVICDTKEQLLKRERFYIENTKCINKCIPGRTDKEYRVYYYYKNRVNEIKKSHEWNQKNPGKHRASSLKYINNNRDKVNKRKLELYHYQSSWGGNLRTQNNLLSIDTTLFD